MGLTPIRLLTTRRFPPLLGASLPATQFQYRRAATTTTSGGTRGKGSSKPRANSKPRRKQQSENSSWQQTPPSATTSSEAPSSSHLHLVEDTLGFETQKLSSFLKTLKGEAVDDVRGTSPASAEVSIVDSLRKPPVVKSSGSVLNTAILRLLRDDGSNNGDVWCCEHTQEWKSIFDSLAMLHKSVAPEGSIERVVAEARLLAPGHPSACTLDELTRAMVSSTEYLAALAWRLLVGTIKAYRYHVRVTSNGSTSSTAEDKEYKENNIFAINAIVDVVEKIVAKSTLPLGEAHVFDQVWISSCGRDALVTLDFLKASNALPASATVDQQLHAYILKLCRSAMMDRLADTSESVQGPSTHSASLFLKAAVGASQHLLRYESQGHHKRPTDEGLLSRCYLSHLVWVSHALRNFYTSPAALTLNSLETDAANVMDSLWKCIARTGDDHVSGDRSMTHRTIHSGLNIVLSDTYQVLKGSAAKDKFTREYMNDPAMPLDTLVTAMKGLLHTVRAAKGSECGTLIAAPFLSNASSPFHQKASAYFYGILLRTMLSVDLMVTLMCCKALGKGWHTQKFLGLSSNEMAKQTDTWNKPLVEGDMITHYTRLHTACDDLRVQCSGITRDVFVALHIKQQSTGVSDPKKGNNKSSGASTESRSKSLTDLFLRQIQMSFNSLMRQHYLLQSQQDQEQATAGSLALYAACLEVFLVLRSSQLQEVGSPSTYSHKDAGRQFFGTTLLQAMEVAFFLQYYQTQQNLSSSSASSGGATQTGVINSADVREYVKDMLHCLGVNTARQLRHLRTNDIMYYFTGLKRDKSFITDELLIERHVKSTISVVHAHVMHPSVLWMPLWQLQEMVFVVSNHMDLLYEQHQDEGKGATIPIPQEAHSLEELAESSPKQTELPYVRARVRVGGTDTDFAQVHGYFVLRIGVISSVLRSYQDILTEKGSPAERKAMERAGIHEPAADKRRRQESEAWALKTALRMRRIFPNGPAEMEGVVDAALGAELTLRRMNALIRLCLQNHFFFNVVRENIMTQQKRRAAREAIHSTDSEPASSPSSDGAVQSDVVHLTLQRERAEEPLGFVLDAAGVVTRLPPSADANDSPFDVAVRTHRSDTPIGGDGGALADPSQFLGWRVTAVDGCAVSTAREVIGLVRDKLSFSLTLECAVKDN